MYSNSTIRQKVGVCPMCAGSNKQPLLKGLCQNHYWQTIRMKSAQKASRKEIVNEPGLPELIEEADVVFSRYVRMSAVNERGILGCFICGSRILYKRAQAMHFVGRESYYLRWDLRNVRAGCEDCNCYKRGNLALFAQKLNEESQGLADLLLEESRIIYKPTREEVRQIIGEYSEKNRSFKMDFKI